MCELLSRIDDHRMLQKLWLDGYLSIRHHQMRQGGLHEWVRSSVSLSEGRFVQAIQ